METKTKIKVNTNKKSKYTEKEKKKFNEILRGIKTRNLRMKVYDQYRRNNFVIPEDEEEPDSRRKIEVIYKKQPEPEIKKQKKSKKFLIFIIIGIILVLIALGIALYFILRKQQEKPIPEKLISNLTYKENQIMKFQNVKTTKINYEFGNVEASNSSKIFKEYFDFRIGIISQDKIVENKTEKEVFSGYIFLENYMIDNETEKMLMQNSSLFEETEIGKNMRNLFGLRNMNFEEKKFFNFSINDIKIYCCLDNETLPIMKFDFYKNGQIRKIFKPKNLITLFNDRMLEILEKVIPRIAQEDFNYTYNNISEALENEYEKIKQNIENDSEDEIEDKSENESLDEDFYDDYDYREEEFEEENEEIKGRLLKREKSSKIIKIKKRKLNLNDTGETDVLESESFDYEEINEILQQEFNTEQDFNVYMFNKDQNETKTNLNSYSHSPIRNNYAEFKGSLQNTSVISIIDENEKSLKEVHYITKGKLINDTNFGEELENERKQSCSNDNLLDCQDMADDTYENVIDSKFKSIDYEIFEDIVSTGNYIDNKKLSIKIFEEIFKKYENNLEIIENFQRTNSSKRLLRYITDYFLANKFEFSDVELEFGEEIKNRKLEEYSGYYGMKNMEYIKNLFSLNLIGIQMKLQITNTMIVNEGESVVKIKLQFAFIKISITLKTIKTNMHLAIRNANEMGYTQLYLINESKNKLERRNEKYSNIILNLEKEFNSLLVDKHDFSNIFKDSFSEMYEEIKHFTSEIFEEFINIIRNAYDNYTEILDDVGKNKHEIFNEIRIITKNEYIDFINKMLLLVEEFNNKTCDFLLEVKEEVAKIENFQLDLLYDLIDIIYESKKIFKDFNKNLFLAIEKGIKTFRLDFQDFLYEMMGNLLYLVEFLSVNLNKNDILKNAMDQGTREDLTMKLKNMRNIINIITETLLKSIDNDYKEEIDESNINSIKVYSEEKLKKYLDDLEEKSMKIIEDIKNKIAFINLYELYAGNLDKIEESTKEINEGFISGLYEDTIDNIKKLKPEYLNNNSQLIEKREKLLEIVKLINKNINEETNEINDYIISYTKDFKIKRQYNIYYNLYFFRKSFLDDSLDNLRGNFDKFGIEWLTEIYNWLIPLHKRDECLQSEFYSKYSNFIKVFESFLPNAYSDKSIEIYRKYFNEIKNNILTTVRSKITKINYYYFNTSIYQKNFYFLYQINNEIEYLINNIEKYYSEDYFDTKLAPNIFKITSETLGPINDNLYKIFEDLRKKCEQYTDCVRNRYWGDYCWNNNRVLKNWHYISVPHTNNYIKLDSSFNNVENFIKNESTIIINEFISSFSTYINSYINEVQILFDDLYYYTERKLNSSESLNNLISQYLKIFNNMEETAENEIDFKGKNVEFLMQNIYDKTINIEKDIFENYYLKNFYSYLEYPDEILYKIFNLENELKSSSEIVKQQMNYLVNKKLRRIKEEHYYFFQKTNEFFCKLIKLNIDKTKIFDYYKEYRLIENFGKIFGKSINKNFTIKESFSENSYDINIKKIINDYKNIVSKIEKRINNDWIFKNCTKTDNTDIENETSIVCIEYKNKSSLNYSEYNYNVVKIRTGIYYIKYLYENLESLFEQFNFDILMNTSLIIQKDEIINDKNILKLYEKSIEKIDKFNQESEDLFEEYLYYYEEEINDTIKNEVDFTKNFKKFEKILKFTENNFVIEVNKTINKSAYEFFKLINYYNDTLREKIELVKNYQKFNFNFTNFKNFSDKILTEIEISFDNLTNNIKIQDCFLKNVLKDKIENLNNEKAKYFRNVVEDLSENYEIKPFNLTFDVGEKTEYFICNVFDNIMFSYIYDYIELYESNKNIFINSLLEIVNIKKKEAIITINDITNNFYYELELYSEKSINNDYVKRYQNNYTLCLNYSIDKLNETLEKDEKNYNKYITNQNRLDICEKIRVNNYNISDINIIKLNINDTKIIEIIEKLKTEKYKDFNIVINSSDYNFNDTEEEEEII